MGSIEHLLHNLGTQNSNCVTNVEDEYHQDSSCPSDCESGISGTETEHHQVIHPFDNGLIRICEGEMIYEVIKKKLALTLSSCGYTAEVDAIHRNNFSNIMTRAKLQTFSIYSKAIEAKYGTNANVKYAWYGASKNDIRRILSHGFGFPMTHGQGVYLSPIDCPLQSVQLASSDEDGKKHMLLCRVILGKTELIAPGLRQYNPSSEEFDSGVDNLESPGKYIIWSSCMNTHILPEFVISFRASSYFGNEKNLRPLRVPKSDWMPFPNLITTLSKFLPPNAVQLIENKHVDYRKQRITRSELIRLVRQIAGDKLLMTIIKSYRRKQLDRRN